MPTRNVSLTPELDRFVASRIRKGAYENASEVVRAALRSLDREEREFEAKLERLRVEIDAGEASGPVRGDSFARIRRKLKLPGRAA